VQKWLSLAGVGLSWYVFCDRARKAQGQGSQFGAVQVFAILFVLQSRYSGSLTVTAWLIVAAAPRLSPVALHRSICSPLFVGEVSHVAKKPSACPADRRKGRVDLDLVEAVVVLKPLDEGQYIVVAWVCVLFLAWVSISAPDGSLFRAASRYDCP